jgi:hypothetical protein
MLRPYESPARRSTAPRRNLAFHPPTDAAPDTERQALGPAAQILEYSLGATPTLAAKSRVKCAWSL